VEHKVLHSSISGSGLTTILLQQEVDLVIKFNSSRIIMVVQVVQVVVVAEVVVAANFN
jgi:hypothetical protein